MIVCKDKCFNLLDTMDKPYKNGFVRCSKCEKYIPKDMIIDDKLCFCCNGLVRFKPRANRYRKLLITKRY